MRVAPISVFVLLSVACGDDAATSDAEADAVSGTETTVTDTTVPETTETDTIASDAPDASDDADATPDASDDVDATPDARTEPDSETSPDTSPDTEPDAGPEVVPWPAPIQLGTAASDEALDLVVDDDGSVLVAGYDFGQLDITNIKPAGNTGAWVRRIDAHGVAAGSWRLESNTTDVAEAVLPGPDGGIVVVGRTLGALGTTANAGHFDLFVAELDQDGDVVRLGQFGDERPQHPRHVARHGADLVVVGWDDEHIQHQQLMDNENGFVGRYRVTDGQIVEVSRVRTQATFNPDRTEALAVTDEAIFTAGFRFFEDVDGPGGAFVARQPHDAEASGAWRTFLSVGGVQPQALAVTAARVYVAGGTVFPFDKGMDDVGEQDGFVAALDHDGNVLWSRRYGTATFDMVRDLALAPDGTLRVAGYTLGTLPGQEPAGGSDAFVMAIDTDGAHLGHWQGGSAGDEIVHALALGPDGRTFIAGGTSGALVDGQANAGQVDAFVREVVLDAAAQPASPR